jgi:AraC-like DNA-binding protein
MLAAPATELESAPTSKSPLASNNKSRLRPQGCRKSGQLFAALNALPVHTWYAAPSGGLTFVNGRTADYVGLRPDHPLRFNIDIGAAWDAHIPLLHPDDRQETRKVWSACLRTGRSGEVRFRVRGADGGYAWFLSRAEPFRSSDGTLLRWVGVNLDFGAHLDVLDSESANHISREPSTNPLDNRRLRRVLEYIDAHLAEDITVAALAKVACFSVFHFTRAFSAAVGAPPQRYVRQRRLERAKALIAVESISIARAAFMCGFSSQASFTRAFRKAAGMTPAGYRRAFSS